jgi:hypothetical protein
MCIIGHRPFTQANHTRSAAALVTTVYHHFQYVSGVCVHGLLAITKEFVVYIKHVSE